MAIDAWGFDVDRQAQARRLRSLRFRLSILRVATVTGLVVWLLLAGSLWIRDLVLSMRWPGWVSAAAFLTVLFLAFAAVEIPFGFVSGHRWEKSSGLSTQTLRGWVKDLGKTLALGLGASIVFGGVLLTLLAASPTWWWLAAWALGFVVSAIVGFLAPVLLVPLFVRYRPLTDAALRIRFESLAARARVPIVGVFELRASEKARRSNAAVMGFGRTRRVVVTDTLVQGFTPEEVESVLAHELAHQKFRDPIHGFVSGSLVSLVIFPIVAWAYSLLYPSFGIRSAADMAGLPLLATLFTLVALPFRPLELSMARSRESRADRFSLALTRDPTHFIAAMVKLHDQGLAVADPKPWETWLLHSHPPGRDRVEMARTFRQPST